MQEEVEEMVADVIRDEAPGPDFTESVQALMRQARELFQEVQYGAAVPVLESAREQAPDDTLVSMLLARPIRSPGVPRTCRRIAAPITGPWRCWMRCWHASPATCWHGCGVHHCGRIWPMTTRSSQNKQAALETAKGGLFEAVAQLELARRHLTRGQADGAYPCTTNCCRSFPGWHACCIHRWVWPKR
jgi:hypothetical protein